MYKKNFIISVYYKKFLIKIFYMNDSKDFFLLTKEKKI